MILQRSEARFQVHWKEKKAKILTYNISQCSVIINATASSSMLLSEYVWK